ncbi:cytosine permease [Virgibacillus sp. JSM 102003]|uniref:cytosine permease n=1 Tax=Virgibacillus sp. JSM 102003 TaxID=1562108 RepID=UPI0035C18A22
MEKNKSFTEEANWNPDPSLYNKDLAPVSNEKGGWKRWTYIAIWMGAIHSISQWTITAAMIQSGMSFWQAFSAALVADLFIFAALIGNSFAGTKYGVPFPVLIRAVFGHRAALIPIFIRGIIGIFWFGVFMYLGSEAITIGLSAIIPGWGNLANIHILGMELTTAIGYIISIIIHYIFVTHGVERIRQFEHWAGPLIMVIAVGLVIWAVDIAGGFAPLVNIESTVPEGEFWGLFFLSVTGIVGTFSTLMVNNPDLTRFAQNQKEQVVGQLIGFPLMFMVYSTMSLLVAAGTVVAYGEAISDPARIIAQFDNPFIVFFGSLILLASIVSVNAATNAIAVGFDLAAIAPKKLTFNRAGIIGISVGIFTAPWLWFGEAEIMNDLFGILGSAMGPILGLMLADYYLIRKRKYDVKSLFVTDGIYSYGNGWNMLAIISFSVGLLVALSGLIIPSLNWLYSYNWFLGVIFGGITYIILMSIKKDQIVEKTSNSYSDAK